MLIVAIIIAAILIVSAIRNSQGSLFNALGQDVPAFVIWAAALFAVGAIGFIKPLKPVSQGLLVLILLVIVMNNYQAILSGLSNASKVGAGAPSGTDQPTPKTTSNVSPSPGTKATGGVINLTDPASILDAGGLGEFGVASGS